MDDRRRMVDRRRDVVQARAKHTFVGLASIVSTGEAQIVTRASRQRSRR
jgi:hypothetical protein